MFRIARLGRRNFGLSGTTRTGALTRAAIAIVFVGIVWEVVTRLADVSNLVLPPPSAVIASMVERTTEGGLVEATVLSAIRVVIGIILGVGLAFIIGIPAGWYERLYRLINPLIQMLRPIPPLAWIPLASIWFGLGMDGIVFVILLGAFLPTVVNTIEAVRSTERSQIELAQVLGLRSGPALILKVSLPAALPMAFNGMRIGIGIAWMSVITAEIAGGSPGLGFTLHEARFDHATDAIIGVMLLIGLLGLATDLLIRRLERRLFGWRQGLVVGA